MTATETARADRRTVWMWLVGSGAALLAGATATVRPDAATWFGVRGPHCPLGACLGPLACPGCGLVRSTAATLQGDLSVAWAIHPAGPVIAGLLVATCAVNFAAVCRYAPRGAATRRDLHSATAATPAPPNAPTLSLALRLRRPARIVLPVAILIGWLLRFALTESSTSPC